MADPEPIAIIGIGCRFPGDVANPEDFWRLLSTGSSGWSVVPADRWNADSFYHPDGTSIQAYNTKSGYFLSQNVADFDSKFFSFGSSEADVTDPQQRILLETTYEALENAGIPIESLKGSDTAVYAALFARDYDRMGYKNLEGLSQFHITGTGEAIVANRISHWFDTRGISMTIDTGCSGSLVALHEACTALRAGHSRMAIVGGTEILLHPDQNVIMSSGGMLNPDGKCYMFDSRGTGYGRGEGVATVIVKRLKDALQDGDTVHAVIRNSGGNQDGRTNGVTLPNPDAQEALIRRVYADARLDPHETPYVEAHGTGTKAGDLAEAQALGHVFSEKSRARNLYVGSVKTNIGHTEASSGLAGLIKSVLVLKKQQIPPNLNFIEPKPGLKLDERQISVPLELLPLIPEGETGAVRVSLNSFGYGGTNAHMILESLEQFLSDNKTHLTSNGINGINGANGVNGVNGANGANGANGTNGTNDTNGINGSHGPPGIEVDDAASASSMPLLFPLSASSEVALNAMPAQIREWLAGRDASASDLRDLSYTLSCRRSLFRWRKAFVASDLAQLVAALDERKISKTRAAPSAKIGFVFTGQGAQWAGMGVELMASSHIFNNSIQESSRILKNLGCEWDLVQELGKQDADGSRINESELAQPTTTIIQMALVDMLAHYGIKPQFVAGHSSGEIAAAYAAGALARDGAVMASFIRGRYSAVAKKLNAVPGSMLATGYGEQAALKAAANLDSEKGRVTVACVNSPASTTLSGDEPAIDYIEGMLKAAGVFARKLKVETAYHSHHMEKVAASYLQSLGDLASNEIRGDVEFYSSVTGAAKTSGFGSAYWVENLVSQVRFNDAMTGLARSMAATGSPDAANILIEIGPHSALQGPINQILSSIPGFKAAYVAPLSRGKNSTDSFSAATARLFELGAKVDFEKWFTRPQHVIDDLLPYPWDHRVKHWAESRLSRDHRLRNFPYHDLLGVYDVMSPIDEPRWRHHLSVQRLPWLKDHVVDDMVIFPGSGYSTMIVEAMKQLVQMQNAGSEFEIAKTIIRDVRIVRPIILPVESTDGPGDDIEVQLILSPSKVSDNSPWYTIRILSLQADQTWASHISGTVRVELESAGVSGKEHNAAVEEAFEALERVQARAQEKLNMDTFYDERRAAGNDWGPSFALLSEASLGPWVGFCKLRVPDIAQWMPSGYFQPHLIHPTTLDASNHMVPAVFHREITNAPLMPVSTEEVVFSSHISSKPGDEMIVAMELKAEDKTAARGNVFVFQHDSATGELELVSSTRGLVMRAVGEGASTASSLPFERKHNYRLHWDDDPDLLSESSFARLVQPQMAKDSAVVEQLSIIEKATAIYLDNVKDMSMVQNPDTAPLPHLREFSRWISEFVNSDTCHKLCGSPSDDEKAETLDQCAHSGIEGEMLGCIGRNLPDILTNSVNPLELLAADDLFERFHHRGPLTPLYKQMVQYTRLLTNKNPQMNVLEVGAGTGSATLPLFEDMGEDTLDLIRSYTYTDISSGFFDTAKDRLDRWKSVIEYRTLDISKDPVDQGFEANTYDLIVASNVFHATRSLRETMTNVRKLLKPGGRLLLVEINKSTAGASRSLGTIFGTLPGWWDFVDERKDSPLLTTKQWHELLLETSFGGIEFASPDCDGPLARASLIISKATEEKNSVDSSPLIDSVSVVFNAASPVGQLTSDALASAFRETGLFSSTGYTWDALPDVQQGAADGTMYVVLDSANSSVLESPSQEMYGHLQNLLVNCSHILWIAFQEDSGPRITPIKGLVTGLARVVRRENEGVRFITIDVTEPVRPGDDVGRLVQEIQRASQLLLEPEIDQSETVDDEFTLSGDRLLIPRVYADKQFNQWTDLVNGRSQLSPQPFKDPALPLRMDVASPGRLSSIQFVHDTDASSPLGSEQIQIDSKAFGVNFRDVLCVFGQLSVFMGECAGVVTAVGSGEFVQRTYKVGDRVVGMQAQPFASYARLSGYQAHVLPENISFAEAASIQVAFTTVYYSFVNVAHLEPGQTVLIHHGSGGVGQAAIQLARHLGAEVFVTVGSEEKKRFLMDYFNITESHILSSRAAPSDLKRHLMRLTGNKGVHVVLNSTSGEMLAESWDCVASFGYHIELGRTDIDKNGYISLAPFKRNVSFASVNLLAIADERPKVFYSVLDKVMALLAQGVLKPVQPLNVFPIDQLESAFRLMSERKHIGKVVVDFAEDTMVQAILPSPPATQLKSDGSYIIAGGLGAVGGILIKHLAARGAGHIITFSRRKLADEERAAREAEVEKLGARLHLLQCDIADEQSVQKTAEYCRQSLPPVRGIIHAGMVIRDRPLSKMTREEWNAALAPKVPGTLNLDQAFGSPDLDFFVTLSSIAATLGNPGQANYSAANAFQDYFVTHHERTTSTRYVSVNLPVVDETQAREAIEAATRSFVLQVSMLFDVGELLQLMDYAMNPSIKLDPPFLHSLMGFDRQSMSMGTGDDLFAAMFRTIPQMQASNSNEETSNVKREVEPLLQAATSFDEAVKVITETTIDKFVRFLNLEADDVGPHQTLSSYGLDSLVSIELKNWMVRTFKVTLQVSELTSARSIAHLAELLASRSKIVPANLSKQAENQESERDQTTETPSTPQNGFASQPDDTDIKGLECCPLPPSEARQPVPDLAVALQNHIDNIAHFALGDDEIENLRAAVQDFLAPGSIGQQLYQAIRKDSRDPNVSNWISKRISEAYYLPMRQSLQYASFMVMDHPSPVPHTQAERAALVAATAFQFKKNIDNGTVEPLFLMETPVCQAQLQWMFNTYRHPHVGKDETRKGAADYCVVFRRGRLFQVPLQDGDAPVSFDTLRAAMTAILEHVQDEGTWAGILTSDNRDSWAKVRNELLEVSPANAHYFQIIESAAFAVNLDDNSPDTFEDHAKQCKLGDGFNRWHDKPVQFVISANGNSGIIIEHSYLDGTTPAALYERLRNAIASYKPSGKEPPKAPAPEEIPLILPSSLDTHIATLRGRWLEDSAARAFVSYELPTLGSRLLGDNKVPIKGVYDILCQLALYLYYGRRVIPNWQPVMLAQFHDGRHDLVQMASKQVRAFCEAAAENDIPAQHKRKLMLVAARDVSRRLREGQDGKGFFRLFTAIEMGWPADVPKASVYEDTLLMRGMDFTITNMNHGTVESITTPLDPNVLRIRYTIWDDQ
ncbi:Type I Iterative PKS [Emmonsiellopsis sp. PD_5]|nr:Type I Iterative PKS [Emmonsiellopsis sp. PD_5]